MAKEIVCAFGTDVDSVAGWIGSYGGGDSPSDIQRGIFASEVGIIRLLNLFKKYKLKTTFFIPGHSIDTFPNECRKIVEEGHEIGAHGYSHENPVAMTPKQEEAVLLKSIRGHREAQRQEASRLCRAMVGDVGVDRGAPAEIRIQI